MMTASFSPASFIMAIQSLTINPEKPQNTSPASRSVPFRFEVSDEDKMYAVVNGIDCRDAKAAAKYVVETIFTIPSA
jgi:hypothetical protein